MIIDTHSHIYLEQFDEDRKQIIESARNLGVEIILLPNIDSETIDRLHQTEERYEGCYAMMGLHPTSVKANFMSELKLVEKHLFSREYVGVGEIGIDLYWDKSHLKEQIIAFGKQIDWAKELDIPIVIHCRDAFDEVFQVVDKKADGRLRGVFHSFSGGDDEANHIIRYETFKLGINGVVTFKKSNLSDVLGKINPKFVVVETDAPFLTPAPHRGKRNEPAYVRLVFDKLKEIYQKNDSDLEAILESNTRELFKV